VEKLYQFGLNIGIGFQLQDDYLDVYANAEKFGKNIGSDILSNKKTYLLISALNSKESNIVAELRHWISKENFDPEEKILFVRNIYDKLAIGKATEETVKQYFSRGLEYLQQINLPGSKKAEINNFVEKLISREY